MRLANPRGMMVFANLYCCRLLNGGYRQPLFLLPHLHLWFAASGTGDHGMAIVADAWLNPHKLVAADLFPLGVALPEWTAKGNSRLLVPHLPWPRRRQPDFPCGAH